MEELIALPKISTAPPELIWVELASWPDSVPALRLEFVRAKFPAAEIITSPPELMVLFSTSINPIYKLAVGQRVIYKLALKTILI